MVNYVFGFAPTMAGMALRPCMPENLGGSCVTKMFRGCTTVCFTDTPGMTV